MRCTQIAEANKKKRRRKNQTQQAFIVFCSVYLARVHFIMASAVNTTAAIKWDCSHTRNGIWQNIVCYRCQTTAAAATAAKKKAKGAKSIIARRGCFGFVFLSMCVMCLCLITNRRFIVIINMKMVIAIIRLEFLLHKTTQWLCVACALLQHPQASTRCDFCGLHEAARLGRPFCNDNCLSEQSHAFYVSIRCGW